MPPESTGVYRDEPSPDLHVQPGYARLQALRQRIMGGKELTARVRPHGPGWDCEKDRVTGLEAWGRQVLKAL